MNKPMSMGLVLLSFWLLGVNITGADDCDQGRAILEEAFADAPDEMTGPYINVALLSCPGSTDLFVRIAQYYDGWYQDETDPDRKAEFRRLACHYYLKAVDPNSDGGSEEIRTRLAGVESSQEFNETAFRALRPTSQGKTGSGLRLDVYFDRDSYKLSNTAQTHLDALGKILAADPSVNISLEGHTDMKGAWDYNESLSLKRAKSAREYLVKKFGVEEDRILVSGFGFERLADKTAPYSAVNRRVEVIKLSD